MKDIIRKERVFGTSGLQVAKSAKGNIYCSALQTVPKESREEQTEEEEEEAAAVKRYPQLGSQKKGRKNETRTASCVKMEMKV